jgi:hypothetical protein
MTLDSIFAVLQQMKTIERERERERERVSFGENELSCELVFKEM